MAQREGCPEKHGPLAYAVGYCTYDSGAPTSEVQKCRYYRA